ncbi:sensor histidine kinase [Fibrella forsythiae]|uniref:histidine kinase n=1 Tax=Fibrella forsythiae TaxID=2817061 RepID=A0ABS3JCV2_9BACT|nr:HAMP domain-containing sensor histidine kinase [Fibrella forsythiae]MBO0947825.1 HAMP domain-containing histidine kinase [Fibrella forsythiae]
MNDTNTDLTGNTSHSASLLRQLEQANSELTRKLADCTTELQQLRGALRESERQSVQERHNDAERTRLLARERELHDLKSNFVTLASHEFRTPMMTIMSSASLIGSYNSPADEDKRERHVLRIKSAINSLTRILNDFMAISQMDQAIISSHPYQFDLIDFCRDVINDTVAVARTGQRFSYTHTTGPSQISIDGQLLKNILLNLLTNASKYSSDDMDIQLTSAVLDNQLIIAVQDHGIGIPDVDKDKLFTNFFRARNAIHIQGTGLGLYLVKRYVDLLEGSIQFTSQQNEGTVFTVRLPLSTEAV